MKALSKIALLGLLISLVLVSCKSDKSKSYRAYYQTINREYANIKNAQTAEMGELDLDMQDPGRDEMANLEKELAEAQSEAQAYKDAFQKAFPQGTPQQQATTPQPTPQTPTPRPTTAQPYVEEDLSKVFREDDVTPTNGYEGQLKKYNVVVATLSKEEGVERLKKSFASSSEDIVVVRNDRGLYSFVLGSYDDRESAIAKREEVLRNYAQAYSHIDLMNRYGIPFSDTWILIKK